MRCTKMDWNMVESRARSTGMCLSDRPFMDHAGVNPADKLQRLLLKSCQCCPWPMCRTSDAVGMINPGEQQFRKCKRSFRALISNGNDPGLLAELRLKSGLEWHRHARNIVVATWMSETLSAASFSCVSAAEWETDWSRSTVRTGCRPGRPSSNAFINRGPGLGTNVCFHR